VASAKAIFLDRDGVLNEAIIRDGKPLSPQTLSEVVVPTDATEVLGRLRAGGFLLIMVTNQPDIARKKNSRENIDEINQYLRGKLALNGVEICPHDDADNCDCRKPKPGMLLRAAKRDGILLSESFMIGDRWRDIDAGRRAGCRTILIGAGYDEGLKSPPDITVDNLSEAANWILAQPDNSQVKA
jgi:D-glycero-D-manno-heptose 1,7-bisphosphate phosphatase